MVESPFGAKLVIHCQNWSRRPYRIRIQIPVLVYVYSSMGEVRVCVRVCERMCVRAFDVRITSQVNKRPA